MPSPWIGVFFGAVAVLVSVLGYFRHRSQDNSDDLRAIAKQVIADDRDAHAKEIQANITAAVVAIREQSKDERATLRTELEATFRAVVLEARLAIVQDVSSKLDAYARRDLVDAEFSNLNHRVSRQADQIEDLGRLIHGNARKSAERG